jgi:hypothetical protein
MGIRPYQPCIILGKCPFNKLGMLLSPNKFVWPFSKFVTTNMGGTCKDSQCFQAHYKKV